MLLAVDGSDESKRAAEVTEGLAQQFGSEVVVVHVVDTFYSGAATWSPRLVHFAQCPVLIVKGLGDRPPGQEA